MNDEWKRIRKYGSRKDTCNEGVNTERNAMLNGDEMVLHVFGHSC